jgi:glutamate dehydrogenase (NAD(P)+)
VQALQEYFWSEKEVNAKLKELMDRAFESVYAVAQQRKIDMRRAAYVVGVTRVAEAHRLRGLYP